MPAPDVQQRPDVVRPAAAPAVRTLTKFVALAYRYDPVTRRTTVTKSRRTTTSVQVVRAYGRTAYKERTRTGTWALVPYVWSAAQQGLVYDRALHLQLLRTSTARAAVPFVTRDLDLHLLRRATFGPTTASLAELRALGRDAWLDRQLAPATIDDRACDALVAGAFPHMTEPVWHVNELLENGTLSGWEHTRDIAAHHVARQCWSKRQLLEVIVDFWSNHFSVNLWKDGVTASRADLQRVLRAGAFGRFADLLWAVTSHPSMLIYLNNAESTDEHPNENLGRELLELHTVGVGAPYGEDGVLTSARILTGLSVSSDSAEFLYEPWKHWVGPVSVLGFTDPNPTQPGGLAVARRYVAHLARHPLTAGRIARRLCQLFVADAPPQPLVDRLAALYLAQDTRIAPLLKALLSSPEFEAAVGTKVRRPNEYVVSVVRAMELRPSLTGVRDAANAIADRMDDVGMYPMGRETPDGYPVKASAWLSTSALLGRWNAAMGLVQGWGSGDDLVGPDLQTFLFGGTLPATCGAAVDLAARKLLGAPMLPADRNALLTMAGLTATSTTADEGWFVSDYLPWWVVAMLQSPYGLTA